MAGGTCPAQDKALPCLCAVPWLLSLSLPPVTGQEALSWEDEKMLQLSAQSQARRPQTHRTLGG